MLQPQPSSYKSIATGYFTPEPRDPTFAMPQPSPVVIGLLATTTHSIATSNSIHETKPIATTTNTTRSFGTKQWSGRNLLTYPDGYVASQSMDCGGISTVLRVVNFPPLTSRDRGMLARALPLCHGWCRCRGLADMWVVREESVGKGTWIRMQTCCTLCVSDDDCVMRLSQVFYG